MGWNTAGQSHDAVYDSIKSMRLYHLYHQLQQDPANWKNAQVTRGLTFTFECGLGICALGVFGAMFLVCALKGIGSATGC